MRIVVTGGAGRLGQLTIGELFDHGHEVLSIDKVPILESVCPCSVIDLLQAQDLAEAFEWADGLIHLARKKFPYTSNGFDPVSRTWKTPDVLGDAAIFSYNVTYSVLSLKAWRQSRYLVSPEYRRGDKTCWTKPRSRSAASPMGILTWRSPAGQALG